MVTGLWSPLSGDRANIQQLLAMLRLGLICITRLIPRGGSVLLAGDQRERPSTVPGSHLRGELISAIAHSFPGGMRQQPGLRKIRLDLERGSEIGYSLAAATGE